MKKYSTIAFTIMYLIMITFFRFDVFAQEKSGYVLDKSTIDKLLNMGVYRGYEHDRQDLGIYMKAGSSFKFCNYTNIELIIELLNDGYVSEKSTKVVKNSNGEEIKSNNSISVAYNECKTISAEVDSVPFVRTRFSKTLTRFNYEIKDQSSGIEDLTIFKKGNNERNFINTWKGNNHKFAVITDDFIQFLVPSADIPLVEAIVNGQSEAEHPFSSINDMLEWYDGLITRYYMYTGSSFVGNESIFNKYIGTYSYNSQNDYDKIIPQKFFVKADKYFNINLEHRWIAAWEQNYIACYTVPNGSINKNIETVVPTISYFLEKGWVIVHEIGHAFEVKKRNSNDLKLNEVETNFFAYEEAIRYMNIQNRQSGTIEILYDGKSQQDYMNVINGISNFNELLPSGASTSTNAQERLFAFENLFDKIDMKVVMPHASRKYRENVNSVGFENKMSNTDLFGKYFSEASGYNVIPYLNSVKIFPSESISNEVFENQQPMVYMIANIANESTAASIAENKKLRGPYSVVTNSDIKKYATDNNITRNIEFTITTNDNNKLINKTLFIRSSEGDIVAHQELTGNEVTIENIPVGLYYVDISKGNISNLNYLVVPQSDALLPSNNANTSSGNTLKVSLEYKYDPNSPTEVESPEAGKFTFSSLIIGMIFIIVGILIITYKIYSDNKKKINL